MSLVEALPGALPEAPVRATAKPLTASRVEALPPEVPMPASYITNYGTPGVVHKRPEESDSNWKRRARIAQNIVKFGIRVHCTKCHARGRHFVAISGPLRERPCPNCDKRTLKRTARDVYSR